MREEALHALAAAAGLQVDWSDAAGEARTVGPDALRDILAAMGASCAGEAEMLRERERLDTEAHEADGRFLTATAGEWVRTPLPPGLPVELAAEDGSARLAELRSGGGPASLRAPEAPGYYTLVVGSSELTLAVAPRQAWTLADAAPGRRLWGAAAQVYSLRGRREVAFGDFAALADTARMLGRRGADVLAISPVHALFAADPSRFSPYAPSTRLFLNVQLAAAAAPGKADPQAGGELIDWPIAGRAKLARLRDAYDAFVADGSAADQADLRRFRRGRSEDLEHHAVFEALHARFLAETGAAGWQGWPQAFHDPAGPAVAAFAHENAREVDFHVFLQWLADRGLAQAQAACREAGMAIGLIADLAVGMDAGGSHAWSRPGDLLKGLSVGAPPDVFQPAGQDWGLTAFSPQALRRDGYRAFICTLRAAMRHAGGIRIDHAMGLRRLWLIPHGAGADQGAYLRYPFEDMLRLLALESWRARAIVVGEDLGTVPEGFREATTAMGMMGMRVLAFEREADEDFIPPQRWSRQAMAMTSTHDLPTIAGWWRGRDIDWMERLDRRGRHVDAASERAGREADRDRLWRACQAAGAAGDGPMPPPIDAGKAVDAAVDYVARAGCDLAVLPLEDLLGLEEQPNLPGTIDEHPNWRRRLSADLDILLGAPAVARRIERLNAERPRPAAPDEDEA